MIKVYNLIKSNKIKNIKNTKILYYCNESLNFITAKFDVSNKYFDNLSKKENDIINSNWELKKNSFFNGKLMQFNSIDNVSNFSFVLTDYKSFVGSRLNEFLENCNNIDNISNPLSVTGIVETNDNKVVIGTRGKNKNLWQVPGGMFDPDEDIINDEMNFINCIKREYKEELCELNLFDFKFIGIVCNCELIFSTLVFVCKSKESSLFIKNNHKEDIVQDFWELPEIDFVDIDKNKITELIIGTENIQLIGTNLPSFLLYGRIKFGDIWFKDMLDYFYKQ